MNADQVRSLEEEEELIVRAGKRLTEKSQVTGHYLHQCLPPLDEDKYYHCKIILPIDY